MSQHLQVENLEIRRIVAIYGAVYSLLVGLIIAVVAP